MSQTIEVRFKGTRKAYFDGLREKVRATGKKVGRASVKR